MIFHLLAALALGGSGGGLPVRSPASVGMSPERLEIIEQMPWTPTGKIQKFVLRDIAKALTVA